MVLVIPFACSRTQTFSFFVRLTGASSELQAQERAFHDWEATVLRNVLDGLRGIIQRASEWK